MGRVNRNCRKANVSALEFPCSHAGRGSPIMCPMDTYISGTRKPKDTHRRTRVARHSFAPAAGFFSMDFVSEPRADAP